MGQAKLRQKLNGGQPLSFRHDHFRDFVEQVNNYGAAFLISQGGGQDRSELIQPEDAAKLDFSAPSYDFNTVFLNSNSVTDDVKRAIHVALPSGHIHLPHERCFFLFNFVGRKHDTVIEAVEGTDTISIRAWYGPNNRWIEQAAEFVLDRNDGSGAFHSNFQGSPARIELFQTFAGLVCAACLMLATRPEDNIIEQTELPIAPARAASSNRGEVYPTRLIRIRSTPSNRFDWSKVRPENPRRASSATGASRSPHDRRGHERVYKKTGLRIWINETKIKGGAPLPRPAVVQVMN